MVFGCKHYHHKPFFLHNISQESIYALFTHNMFSLVHFKGVVLAAL